MREITEAQRNLIIANGGTEDDVAAWQENAADFDWVTLEEWAQVKKALSR